MSLQIQGFAVEKPLLVALRRPTDEAVASDQRSDMVRLSHFTPPIRAAYRCLRVAMASRAGWRRKQRRLP